MINPVSKMIAIIVAVILITCISPMQTFQTIEQYKIYNVNNITLEFSEIVREKGYVSRKLYEDYIYKLSKLGDDFDIEIKHIEYKKYPSLNVDGSVKLGEWEEHEFEYPAKYIIDYLYEIDYSHTPKAFINQEYFMEVGGFFIISVADNKKTGAMVFRNSDFNPVRARYGGLIKGAER